jgi:hypothetical protein
MPAGEEGLAVPTRWLRPHSEIPRAALADLYVRIANYG